MKAVGPVGPDGPDSFQLASGQLEAVGWLSGMLCRAAVGECSLSGLESRVGQVPVGRFGKLSGFRKICGLSGVGQAALSDENGLRRFGKKTCRNLFVGNLGLSGSSRLVGGAMLSVPNQSCRVLNTVGPVG